jgi:hypothetical protein
MTTPSPLSYQEILRTLGGVLDNVGSGVAVIHLNPTGARLTADQATVPEDWGPEALAAEALRQQQQRTDEGASATPWASRLAWQLRLVGAALDLVGEGPYTIVARPEEIFVFNARGYHRAFRNTALERRAALAPEFRGQATTCPVCSESESLVPLVHALSDEEVLEADEHSAAPSQPTHRCRLCGASVRLVAPPL